VILAQGAIKVQVVFSIAGGAGSGMFLDIDFLVRDIVRGVQPLNLTLEAVILLPTAFTSEPRHRVYANSYAALLELEHYSVKKKDDDNAGEGGGRFPVYWDGVYTTGGPLESITGPAFDANWLIGNTSRGVKQGVAGSRLGTTPADKRAFTGMIADWLYLRASPRGTGFANVVNAYVISNAMSTEFSATARLKIMDDGSSTFVDAGYDLTLIPARPLT
jgi:hypothetical protein